MTTGTVADNVARVRARIDQAARRVGRSGDEITVVAAAKHQAPERIQDAIRAGISVIGENRVQEAIEKVAALHASPVSWHLIGHLQTNKVSRAVDLFAMIQSVDSKRLALALERTATLRNQTVDILLEVNISGERSKHGFSVAEVEQAVDELTKMRHLRPRGLMTMAPLTSDLSQVRPIFRKLRQLRDRLASQWSDMDMSTLSMGMTEDFEVAVEEGSTMVRLGRAIFGPHRP